MKGSANLDIVGFNRAVADLAKLSGKDVQETLRSEAGVILKTCAGRTKVAKAAAITTNTRLAVHHSLELGTKFGSPISITVGVRNAANFGKVWLTRRSAGKSRSVQQTHAAGFLPLNRHHKNGDWIDLKEAIHDFQLQLERRLPLALRSAGLARQSWVQIADQLGITLEMVPGGALSAAGLAKARAAIASDGRQYQNGFGRRYEKNKLFVYELVNRLPYGRSSGLDGVLVRTVNGRTKFFKTNMAKGVFDRASKIARAYPGLKLRQSAA